MPSLAYMSFPAGRFEREMADLYGIRPIGHPRPRRLVRHAHWPADWHPMRADAGPPPEFESTGRFPFVTVEGAVSQQTIDQLITHFQTLLDAASRAPVNSVRAAGDNDMGIIHRAAIVDRVGAA